MELPTTSIGAVIGALIAAAISLVGLLISKDLKTTEFRQAWIEKLREDVAQFLSYHALIKYQIQLKDPEKKNDVNFRVDTFESLKDEIVKMERVYSEILLRLNPKEHTAIIVKLNEFRDLYTQKDILSYKIMEAHESELLGLFQKELKKEWKRVKSGELAFRLAKYSAVCLLVIGGGALVETTYQESVKVELISNNGN